MKHWQRRQLILILPVLGTAGLTSIWAQAQPPEGKGHGKAGKHGKSEDREERNDGGGAQISIGISVEQARSYALQGGFTGYKPLPPGIRKNLARGKPLPPGIAKHAAPAALLRQLPQRPGYEWQVCGTDLVLVAVGTLIVAEVLKSVFD